MLQIKSLNLVKKQYVILNDISFECMPGTITILIGKSGAGKTSLLKCIGQLDRSYTGTLMFNTEDLKKYQHTAKADLIGFVFQQYNLFPHMSVLENCTNPLKIVKKYDVSKAEKIAYSLLERFGLKNLASSFPHQLSGGQQQRVAIARTLGFNPRILCLDEPSAALDPENAALLVSMLKDLAKEGATLIISTQDMPFAQEAADFLIMLEDGKLVEKCNLNDRITSPKINKFINFKN